MKYFLLTTWVSSKHSFKYFNILRKKTDLLKREDLLVAEFGLIWEMVQSNKARPYQIPKERAPYKHSDGRTAHLKHITQGIN